MKGIITRKSLIEDKRAIEWVSTVIYTLIGLSVITLLLSVVRPKLAEMKDSYTLDQTIATLSKLDKTVSEITRATGNTREFMLYISRGTLTIDTANNKIEWLIDNSNYQFSEPGIDVYPAGNIKATTTKKGSTYDILLVLDYTDKKFNLTIDNADAAQPRAIQPAKAAYSIFVENKGYKSGAESDVKQIDLRIG